MPGLRGGAGSATPFRTKLFHAHGEEDASTGIDPLDIAPFPIFEQEDLRNGAFFLIYQQYGGSGLGMSYHDVMEMDLDEMLWFLKKLEETREAEARELSKKK